MEISDAVGRFTGQYEILLHDVLGGIHTHLSKTYRVLSGGWLPPPLLLGMARLRPQLQPRQLKVGFNWISRATKWPGSPLHRLLPCISVLHTLASEALQVRIIHEENSGCTR